MQIKRDVRTGCDHAGEQRDGQLEPAGLSSLQLQVKSTDAN